MLLNMCKSCQYCLETMYWKCCEERFCYDKKIASYRLDEQDISTIHTNGYTNMGASRDSVVVQQPSNNNHLPQYCITGRETSELPFNAGALYEVFSKSMIFRDDHELASNKGSIDTLDEFETKSEPDYLSEKPNRTKVYFEDEVNSPITDFEIMFKDELLAGNMFKIEEEEESDRQSLENDDGLVMNVVSVRKQDVIKPSTITIKDETKITTVNPIYEYDPTVAVPTLKTSLSIPRGDSVKGILRQNKGLPRSLSAKVISRDDSVPKLFKPTYNRVDSIKTADPDSLNKVLSRVPLRSASFLNIPDHLMPEKPPLIKSKSTIGVVSLEDDMKISKLPDTPIIKSSNLPRFFADSTEVPEYKGDTSLQSIQQKQTKIFNENDFSMPRYGKIPSPTEIVPVHESKSMPDLRNPAASGKVSKRLVKIRSKLKPLVIKKGTDEKL